MPDEIPWAAVTDIGAGGLVVLVVLLILAGKLVPHQSSSRSDRRKSIGAPHARGSRKRTGSTLAPPTHSPSVSTPS